MFLHSEVLAAIDLQILTDFFVPCIGESQCIFILLFGISFDMTPYKNKVSNPMIYQGNSSKHLIRFSLNGALKQ